MGVRYLKTYVIRKVPNGFLEIDMAKEVRKYKRKFGVDPTILVDSMTLTKCVYTNNHEVLLSGRHEIFDARTHKVFKSLKSLGVKLVFVFDGPAQEEKIETSLKRRHEKYFKCVKVLDYIGRGGDVSVEPEKLDFPEVTPFLTNYIKIAAKYGEIHMATLNECDLEIANFANRVGALAIISNDTDFLIYEGKWRYWSSADINFTNMRTREFNRVALRKHLKLESHEEMRFFATLSGNDILNYDLLQKFHGGISKNYDKFLAIAEIIRKMRSQLEIGDLRQISRMIFEKLDQNDGKKLIKKSLKSYSYSDMPRSSENQVQEDANEDVINFAILNDRPYIITLLYVDLRDKQFASFTEMILSVVRRQMGILLYRESGSRERTFYCKLSHGGPYLPQKIKPIYPTSDIPPLEELLHDSYGTNQTLDKIRWKLLFWQISEKITSNDTVALNKDMAHSLLCLIFLVEKMKITVVEADCLLLALNCPPDVQNTLKMEDMKVINRRDAMIGFLFVKIHFFVKNWFWTVGLRDFDSLITFDGLYFHNLRREYRLNAESLKEKIAAVESLRIYDSGLN